RRPDREQLAALRDALVVVAEIRLAGVVAVGAVERTIAERRGTIPRRAAVVGELTAVFGQVARGRDALVVIEDVDPAGRLVDRDGRKPLRAIGAGPAVDAKRRAPGRSLIRGPSQDDVRAIAVRVVRVDDIDVARRAGR